LNKINKQRKKKIYVYIDVPISKHQIDQIFPYKFKFFKDLIFINTSDLIFKSEQIKKFYKNIPRNQILKNVKYFKSFIKLKSYFKKIKSSDIFIIYSYLFSLENSKFNFLILFNEIKCKKILIKPHSWIFPNFKKDLFLNSLKFFKYLFNKIFFLSKMYNIKFDYSLSFGEKNKEKNKFLSKNLDYPSYWIKFYKILPAKKIITYVDETLDYSGDQFLFKKKLQKKINNHERYLEKLNMFFAQVEKKYKSRIIICCKKKFRYKKNYFNGRKIIYGKTLEYITKSKLVIGHKSDALIQAIYSKSPVILLKSKEFNLKRNLEINSKSINLFNKKSSFIEDYLNKNAELDTSIDKKFYTNILNNYFISKNQINQNFHEKLTADLKKFLF
jgi:hypothetical protein